MLSGGRISSSSKPRYVKMFKAMILRLWARILQYLQPDGVSVRIAVYSLPPQWLESHTTTLISKLQPDAHTLFHVLCQVSLHYLIVYHDLPPKSELESAMSGNFFCFIQALSSPPDPFAFQKCYLFCRHRDAKA